MSADVLTTLHALVAKRILVLDGAMGTMIQRHTLTEAEFRGARFAGHPHDVKGNNDLLVLTRPDVVSAIHHEYLEAGSDIIETNSFSSTAIAQADYGLEPYVYELNVEAGRLAKAAAVEWTLRTPEKPRFVAGSMGPTNRILSISPDVDNPAFRALTFRKEPVVAPPGSRKSIWRNVTPAMGAISRMSIATTLPLPSAASTRRAAISLQPPGAAPRSTTRAPGLSRRYLSSISISL